MLLHVPCFWAAWPQEIVLDLCSPPSSPSNVVITLWFSRSKSKQHEWCHAQWCKHVSQTLYALFDPLGLPKAGEDIAIECAHTESAVDALMCESFLIDLLHTGGLAAWEVLVERVKKARLPLTGGMRALDYYHNIQQIEIMACGADADALRQRVMCALPNLAQEQVTVISDHAQIISKTIST